MAKIPVFAVRSLVRAKWISPEKGPRGALRFSFQDLVLLRAARSLLLTGVSKRRISKALRSLRAQLPATLPAQGLSVSATGGRLVVSEAGKQRDALSGQLLFSFEIGRQGETVRLTDVTSSATTDDSASGECEQAFAAALALEEIDVEAAVKAYRSCVHRHAHSGARANLGRLLHLQGHITEAVGLYRAGDQSDPDILYNQAVALEDLGRMDEAIATYTRALELDHDHMDAHHNVARLWQLAGDQRRALRHWNAYRRLSRGSDS